MGLFNTIFTLICEIILFYASLLLLNYFIRKEKLDYNIIDVIFKLLKLIFLGVVAYITYTMYQYTVGGVFGAVMAIVIVSIFPASVKLYSLSEMYNPKPSWMQGTFLEGIEDTYRGALSFLVCLFFGTAIICIAALITGTDTSKLYIPP